MSEKYIYTIADLTKKHGQREVLKNIWLAFYPGAKIGVLGRNGSGKSTLLRIMAGGDKDFDGEARIAEGYTAGYLSQEPQLNPGKDVLGNVEEAVGHVAGNSARYDEINARLGEPIDADEMEKLLAEQAESAGPDRVHNAWELDRQIEIAMDAMNLPPGRRRRDEALRRRAATRGAVQDPAREARLAAARRADEPSRCRKRRLAGAAPGRISRHGRRRDARSLFSRQRGRLDSGTRSRPRHSLGRQLLVVAGAEESTPGRGGESRPAPARKRLERELEWIRLAPRARQAKSKARIKAYEQMSSEAFEEREQEFEIQIPPGKHLGDLVVETKNVSKGYGDQLLIENLSFRLPPGGIVGVIGPNGAGKTTLFRMIIGEEKPDKGELHIGDTVELGYVDQNRDALDRRKNRLRRNLRRPRHARDGRPQNQLAGVRGPLQLHRPRPAEKSRRPLRRRTQPRAPGQAAAPRLQCAAARRADERSRRRHAAGLEEAIVNFAGCVVVISHDRWFLDRIATHILAFEGDGYVHWCEGNFQTYEEERKRRLGMEADQPHRFRYKKLVH